MADWIKGLGYYIPPELRNWGTSAKAAANLLRPNPIVNNPNVANLLKAPSVAGVGKVLSDAAITATEVLPGGKLLTAPVKKVSKIADDHFFKSFYPKEKIDYQDASSRDWLKTFDKPIKKPIIKQKDDLNIFAKQKEIANKKQNYIDKRFEQIKNKNGEEAIPADFKNFQKFMMALEKEAGDITLDYTPNITGGIPKYSRYIKPKKGSDSKYTSSAFRDEYMNKVFTLYKDKIPDLEAGHELMRIRRVKLLKETGNERYLEQVKYPVFFTNITRNRAHIRLENNLIKLRNKRKELTANRKLRNKFQNEISQINGTIRNIKHDMEALGVESRIFDETSKKFKKFGKGFSSPLQLHKSLQEEQTLKFLGSKDDPYNVAEKYLVKEGDNIFLPKGLKKGGVINILDIINNRI